MTPGTGRPPIPGGIRVALVISSLGAGGAERVMVTMANHWAACGREVLLITLGSPDGDWYAADPSVRRVGLGLLKPSPGLWAAVRHNLQRLTALRRELRLARPDVVVSFVDRMNVLTLLAATGLSAPVVVSERTDPRRYRIGAVWHILRSVMYRRAAAVVVQTDAVRDWAMQVTDAHRIHVIPNAIGSCGSGTAAGRVLQEAQSGIIVGMGRLSTEKGFDVLIRAFHRCAKKHPQWSLRILGEGEERGPLEALIDALQLKDRISLPGLCREPVRILRSAEMFVLPSRFEGFPNALLEAMACGLPVIATDCAGPQAIIRDGVDGMLVPPDDVDALADAMDRLIEDPSRRRTLGTRAMAVQERFAAGTVMTMWDGLLSGMTFSTIDH